MNINSFLIQTFAVMQYKINGAFSTMKCAILELVSDAYTLVTIYEHKTFIFKPNQVFLDIKPLQK